MTYETWVHSLLEPDEQITTGRKLPVKKYKEIKFTPEQIAEFQRGDNMTDKEKQAIDRLHLAKYGIIF